MPAAFTSVRHARKPTSEEWSTVPSIWASRSRRRGMTWCARTASSKPMASVMRCAISTGQSTLSGSAYSAAAWPSTSATGRTTSVNAAMTSMSPSPRTKCSFVTVGKIIALWKCRIHPLIQTISCRLSHWVAVCATHTKTTWRNRAKRKKFFKKSALSQSDTRLCLRTYIWIRSNGRFLRRRDLTRPSEPKRSAYRQWKRERRRERIRLSVPKSSASYSCSRCSWLWRQHKVAQTQNADEMKLWVNSMLTTQLAHQPSKKTKTQYWQTRWARCPSGQWPLRSRGNNSWSPRGRQLLSERKPTC